jgi:hypothetical protein
MDLFDDLDKGNEAVFETRVFEDANDDESVLMLSENIAEYAIMEINVDKNAENLSCQVWTYTQWVSSLCLKQKVSNSTFVSCKCKVPKDSVAIKLVVSDKVQNENAGATITTEGTETAKPTEGIPTQVDVNTEESVKPGDKKVTTPSNSDNNFEMSSAAAEVTTQSTNGNEVAENKVGQETTKAIIEENGTTKSSSTEKNDINGNSDEKSKPTSETGAATSKQSNMGDERKSTVVMNSNENKVTTEVYDQKSTIENMDQKYTNFQENKNESRTVTTIQTPNDDDNLGKSTDKSKNDNSERDTTIKLPITNEAQLEKGATTEPTQSEALKQNATTTTRLSKTTIPSQKSTLAVIKPTTPSTSKPSGSDNNALNDKKDKIGDLAKNNTISDGKTDESKAPKNILNFYFYLTLFPVKTSSINWAFVALMIAFFVILILLLVIYQCRRLRQNYINLPMVSNQN